MSPTQADLVIAEVSKRIDDLREDLVKRHDELKEYIRDVEGRLAGKITRLGERVDHIEDHEDECRDEVEAAIEKAKTEAIQEATQPGIYQQAMTGLVRFTIRALAAAATAGAVAVAVMTILEKTGLIGG